MKSLFRAALILGLAYQWPGSASQVGMTSANAAYRSVAANILPEPVVFIKPDWIPPEPDWADFGDASYTLYWIDQDVDDNATITLFYDNDQNSGNGSLGVIATGIDENAEEGKVNYVWNTGEIAEGSYVWDTTSIPNGEYYAGATITDEAGGVTSYSAGKVRVYHFPKISAPYEHAGLASIWSDEPYSDNPHLVNRVVFLQWDGLEPCGDDNYAWEVNPASGRYYRDDDVDGVCEDAEGMNFDRFKAEFMERLYEKVDPDCPMNCELKQPLELIDPRAQVYLQINGMGPATLKRNDATGKYEKAPYWLFNHVALLRTPDGDYNANGRIYPSVQFWDPDYKAYYQDLLQDIASELKEYPEIYPYVSLVLAQFNAFNVESGWSDSGESTLCDTFATLDECADYAFSYTSYDPGTRYEAGLAKEYYLDTNNVQQYYYKEANDYHEWVAQAYSDIFKNDPDDKLHPEIMLKPYPTDTYFTPGSVFDGFGYAMVYEHGAWFYQVNAVATGYVQNGNMTMFVHDQKITRGHTEPYKTYATAAEANPKNIIPVRYDNPLQWVYWHVLLDLHRGVDTASFQDNVLAKCRLGVDEEYCDNFELQNRYAGRYFSPVGSPGAWVAFRPLFHPNSLSGNYELHLSQLDADNSSIRLFGYDSCEGDTDCNEMVNLNPPKPDSWDCAVEECPDDSYFGVARNGRVVNLGPKSQPYGLWARSIGSEGKDTITLDIDDLYASSLAPGQSIGINVVYLDRGGDAFAIRYKNGAGNEQTILVDKGTSGNWKGDQQSEGFEISDYRFANSLGGGDLQLLSNGDGEDIFHMVMIEVVEGSGAGPLSVFLPLVVAPP